MLVVCTVAHLNPYLPTLLNLLINSDLWLHSVECYRLRRIEEVMIEPFDVLIVSIQGQGNPAIEKIFCQTKNDELGKRRAAKQRENSCIKLPHGSKYWFLYPTFTEIGSIKMWYRSWLKSIMANDLSFISAVYSGCELGHSLLWSR